MNAEEKNQILGIIKDFEDLFDGNIGYWDTETLELESNPYYKWFNCKYYPINRIKKETFIKGIK